MQKTPIKLLTKILFAAYCLLMVWLLFGQRIYFDADGTYFEQLRSNINLLPFRTIGEYVLDLSDPTAARHAVINLVGNVIMFIPLGLIPLIWKKLSLFRPYILTVAGTVAVIESIQFFTLLGSCDVDDLILNIIGALLGYLIFRLYQSKTQNV